MILKILKILFKLKDKSMVTMIKNNYMIKHICNGKKLPNIPLGGILLHQKVFLQPVTQIEL